ncbi:hypothetical protein PM082_021738 [Marasmius tenuissimus]|nr:hypothetical protein PM082_021738 [Marasmius tenuissimus]
MCILYLGICFCLFQTTAHGQNTSTYAPHMPLVVRNTEIMLLYSFRMDLQPFGHDGCG